MRGEPSLLVRFANNKLLISNFRRVLNVECFLLGNSLASEFYMLAFRNAPSHLHRQVGMKNLLQFPPHRGEVFMILNFRHVLNVVCFLLGNSLMSEFYMPTFGNSVPS